MRVSPDAPTPEGRDTHPRWGSRDAPGEIGSIHVYLSPTVQAHAARAGAPRQDPEYFDKIHKIVEAEGGTVERFLAVMGPWEYFAIIEYPDLEAAFRVLAKIAKLEVFETETFPAEDVKVFWKALV